MSGGTAPNGLSAGGRRFGAAGSAGMTDYDRLLDVGIDGTNAEIA